MDKTNIYLDLSKCSDEQRKRIPKILENSNEELYFLIVKYISKGNYDKYYPYLVFSRPSHNTWVVCRDFADRYEVTYDEFVALFEEKKGQDFSELFDYLSNEHGLILLESDMHEIIHIINKIIN